jgi:DNA-directed RNA polymerase subunit H (RpoH/RPB5)
MHVISIFHKIEKYYGIYIDGIQQDISEMSTSSNQILTIYKSRLNLLDIMEYLKYDISEYNTFSINEIDAMYANDQLDMLIQHPETKRKAYIKYYFTAKQIRKQNLDDIIEDLYTIETVLDKNDTLIIITEDEPNDTITTRTKYLYDHDNIFVVIHNIHRLQYNLLKHALVPECHILNTNEIEELKRKYNITNLMQLPEISRYDPHALAMCMRPGEVAHFKRASISALQSDYYRICL